MQINNLPKIDSSSNYGVFASAQVLIAHFTDLLVDQISRIFVELYGENWQLQMFGGESDFAEFNLRDPQVILKDLARNGASQLRFALNKLIEQSERKVFYDGIDDLLGERNAWVHRQLNESIEDLRELAGFTDDLLLLLKSNKIYTDWIEKNSSHVQFQNSNGADIDEMVERSDKLLSTIKREEDMKLGQPVSERFLSHTYLVGDLGEVIDRNSSVKLSSINSRLATELTVLTKSLRQGSRLRITESGQLCSFFDDHWGFLAQIDSAEWFPNHLPQRVE